MLSRWELDGLKRKYTNAIAQCLALYGHLQSEYEIKMTTSIGAFISLARPLR